LLKGFFQFKNNDETDYLLKIAVSMIPIFVVGIFFKDAVETLFTSLRSVGIALCVTAVLLTFSDYASRFADGKQCLSDRKGYRNNISYWQAFVVGLSQSIAVLPGLSRSGTTIATGLICGVRRDVMAQFSFLMVLIPILGEAFLELLDMLSGEVVSTLELAPMIVGFIAAFVSGCLACKFMINIVRRQKLIYFAIYCLCAGIFAMVYGLC
jgi:undecaprenyl-diphosphatase